MPSDFFSVRLFFLSPEPFMCIDLIIDRFDLVVFAIDCGVSRTLNQILTCELVICVFDMAWSNCECVFRLG